MGAKEKIRTVPMAAAEPVFSRTHQERAIRYRLSPRREIVCPAHKAANGRQVRERRNVS
jgi:hypothetical protein